MMCGKKVSIIVPVYNVVWNLDKCIQCLINQTYANIEIIIINDGSKDDSLKRCYDWAAKDKRIIVIDKPNSGVSDTRNLGILKASGEYIVFVDSDDWVDETYIEDFGVNNIGIEKFIAVQGIIYEVANRNAQNVMFQYPSLKLSISENAEEIKKHKIFNNGCPVAKLFSKKVIVENNLSFNSMLSLNEDHIFVLDYYACINEVFLFDSINYHYYYDYTLPSLTKIAHSSYEYINISYVINNSFKKLIARMNSSEEEWLECHSMFGPEQLIKASFSSLGEEKGNENFIKIVESFKQMVLYPSLLNGEDLYSKSYILFYNKCNVDTFYLIQKVCRFFCVLMRKSKCFIKKLVLGS